MRPIVILLNNYTIISSTVTTRYSAVVCVIVAAVSFLLTEPLPSNDKGMHIQTHWWEEFIKYDVEIGLVSMIHEPSFIKIASSIFKLMKGVHRPTNSWSRSYFTTDSQSVSMSWYRALLWDLRPDITSCRNVAVWNLRSCICGAPSQTWGREEERRKLRG
jgi:hypothetical protein